MVKHRKIEWIKTLKIGDIVCDCSFRHLRITSIKDVYHTKTPKFVKVYGWVWLLRLMDNICRRIGWVYLWDKELTLEDGAQCSALACCDKIDHPEHRLENDYEEY